MAASEGDLLWQPATVMTAKPGRLVVSFEPLSHCQRCLNGQGCGAGVFSRLFPARSTSLAMESQEFFEPGQQVRVGLHPEQLLRAALILYGLPLAGFLAGLVLGHALWQEQALGELYTLLLGLVSGAGLLLAFRIRGPALNPSVQALSCNAADSTLESASD